MNSRYSPRLRIPARADALESRPPVRIRKRFLGPPNNIYNAWCFNPYGYIEPNTVTYTAYSSYDSTFLSQPGAGSTAAWQEINWVINNKKGKSGTLNPSVMDIQNVIWDLLVPGYNTAALSADGAQLLSDAQIYGAGFVPGPGQLIAITLYVGGINSNDTANNPQDIFIEYPLPNNPHLKITKSASVKTAKCTDTVTYKYVVTNTGNVTLTNVVVVDDNATPNYTGDDFTVGTVASLAPGASVTFNKSVLLPVTLNSTDSSGNSYNHQLITKVLPNGDIQVTFLEDQNLIDNSYGSTSSPDWGSQGNSLLSHIGQDSAEFQFTDSLGNVVLDFAADYFSISGNYPSHLGTAGVSGGAGQLFHGYASNIESIDTTMTDNMNQGGAGNWGALVDSPNPGTSKWKFQCGYTVVIKGSAFGKNGFGQCTVKNIQHRYTKAGGYQCKPTAICKTVTNTATVTAYVAGTSQTVMATAQASVMLSPTGQTSCTTQPPPQKCQPKPSRPHCWWQHCVTPWQQCKWW